MEEAVIEGGATISPFVIVGQKSIVSSGVQLSCDLLPFTTAVAVGSQGVLLGCIGELREFPLREFYERHFASAAAADEREVPLEALRETIEQEHYWLHDSLMEFFEARCVKGASHPLQRAVFS